MGDLSGKVAIVTGASTPKGIGNAIAKRFARGGASVYLVADRTREQLEAAVTDCRALGAPESRHEYGLFDLGDEGAAEAMVAKALDLFGRVDVLVNNAGVRSYRRFGEFSRAEFNRVVAVNLAAPFFASQAVVPTMRAQGGGRIIHVASQMGTVAFDNRAVYGLTKAGLIYLTKAMAYELGEDNIIVNAISPGPTLTGPLIERMQKDPEHAQSRLAYVRLKRYGEPEEIAEIAYFLAATTATFLHGENIVVDGGYTTH